MTQIHTRIHIATKSSYLVSFLSFHNVAGKKKFGSLCWKKRKKVISRFALHSPIRTRRVGTPSSQTNPIPLVSLPSACLSSWPLFFSDSSRLISCSSLFLTAFPHFYSPRFPPWRGHLSAPCQAFTPEITSSFTHPLTHARTHTRTHNHTHRHTFNVSAPPRPSQAFLSFKPSSRVSGLLHHPGWTHWACSVVDKDPLLLCPPSELPKK